MTRRPIRGGDASDGDFVKPIKVDLPKDLKELQVVAIADAHIGDGQSDIERIKEDIAYVRDHENAYCVLNGDLMNCAIKTSISDIYSETADPMSELKMCMDLFGCISDKVLCVVPGNHEDRHYRTNGIDITRLMCQQLGIEDRYSPTVALVFLRFGSDTGSTHHNRPILYTIYVTHGSGGGRKDGGKIQRLADYATIVDADIYIAGHTHLGASFKKGFYRPCAANSSITCSTHLFVNTSASLGYGGYAEKGGFDPPCKDRPIIWLSGERKERRATI